MHHICIVGGGASSMAAAITAAKQNPDWAICILEKKEALGKKLRATGNGKCNMTNAACANVKQTLEFFGELGIITRQDETGRIYPYSEQAVEVVYGLKRALDVLGVEVRTGWEVTEIQPAEGGYKILGNGGEIMAEKVLVATGGKSAPQYGTTGDGYRFARALGHTVTKIAPALTAMETSSDFSHIKGLRVKGKASLLQKDKEIAQSSGEIQLTGDGLSGICIFDLSRFVKLDQETTFTDYKVSVDFLPTMKDAQVYHFLKDRTKLKGLAAGDLLLSVLARPLANTLLQERGIRKSQAAVELSAADIQSLAELLKGWIVPLTGLKGWKSAQCTSGGVCLDQVHMETMESKLRPGLYFSGEVLDFDGPCGGYNLQNAWETGIKAGRAMAHV